ncbi:MAG: aldehyde-activating protein [Alphaproteobacteria bacterium]|nr:MAG: aldehyde-activating protein [Alphaproteobacteria bacterium]
MATLEGGCYCGNITVRLETGAEPATITPRACDCDFCTMHGASWLSDAEGTLEIEIQNEAAISLYEQGSESARFWLCQRCGVVTAVTADIHGVRKGAVNAGAMEDRAAFAPATPVSPKQLSADEKLARWDKVWIPRVTVKDCWDVGL